MWKTVIGIRRNSQCDEKWNTYGGVVMVLLGFHLDCAPCSTPEFIMKTMKLSSLLCASVKSCNSCYFWISFQFMNFFLSRERNYFSRRQKIRFKNVTRTTRTAAASWFSLASISAARWRSFSANSRSVGYVWRHRHKKKHTQTILNIDKKIKKLLYFFINKFV